MIRCMRYELSTSGFDSAFQDIASDPSGGGYNVGIRIPSTPPINNTPQTRYLFLLAFASFSAHQKARIVGMRQLVTIGQYIPSDPQDSGSSLYPLEKEIQSSFWHFIDGNITWYLQRIGPSKRNQFNVGNAEGIMFAYANTPALLFQEVTPDYIPPNGGLPYGVPAMPDLSGFHDLRYNAANSRVADLPSIPIEGPCDIALFASVQQTTPATRTKLVLPPGITTSDIPGEDAFVVNFPESVYWRIAGSIVIEEECEEFPHDPTFEDLGVKYAGKKEAK